MLRHDSRDDIWIFVQEFFFLNLYLCKIEANLVWALRRVECRVLSDLRSICVGSRPIPQSLLIGYAAPNLECLIGELLSKTSII